MTFGCQFTRTYFVGYQVIDGRMYLQQQHKKFFDYDDLKKSNCVINFEINWNRPGVYDLCDANRTNKMESFDSPLDRQASVFVVLC